MAGPLTIEIEPTKVLPAAAEAQLLQVALAKNPGSVSLQVKLGSVLNTLDRFEETIALLGPSLGALDSGGALVLSRACFAFRNASHLELAHLAADHAASVANSSSGLARAMAEQAKVQLWRGEGQAATVTLRQAFEIDGLNNAVFKRFTLQLLRQRSFMEVEQLTSDLIAKGVRHSRVLSARTLALAAMGRDDDARSTVGIVRFLNNALIAPPSGWDDLSAFNAALVEELTGHLAIRRDRHGTASIHTERLDSPIAGSTPVWAALLEQIGREVERWANSLSGIDHPWVAARPERAMIRSWCVMTEAEGHERWHMHPDGWLSGGYYPLVSPRTPGGDDKGGSLAFGLPDGLPGADAAMRFGEVAVQPEAGQLMLFPSHAYHRTYAHGKDAQRICVAFDVIPA